MACDNFEFSGHTTYPEILAFILRLALEVYKSFYPCVELLASANVCVHNIFRRSSAILSRNSIPWRYSFQSLAFHFGYITNRIPSNKYSGYKTLYSGTFRRLNRSNETKIRCEITRKQPKIIVNKSIWTNGEIYESGFAITSTHTHTSVCIHYIWSLMVCAQAQAFARDGGTGVSEIGGKTLLALGTNQPK